MMEKCSKIGTSINYIMQVLGMAKLSPYFSDLMRSYEAPFPNHTYKMGCRAMPSHVPIIPDISLEAQKKLESSFMNGINHFYLYLLVMIQ